MFVVSCLLFVERRVLSLLCVVACCVVGLLIVVYGCWFVVCCSCRCLVLLVVRCSLLVDG